LPPTIYVYLATCRQLDISIAEPKNLCQAAIVDHPFMALKIACFWKKLFIPPVAQNPRKWPWKAVKRVF